MPRRRADGFVMISIISERYNIHPQTLRLYEREGLIKPTRTAGNTRLYGEDEIRKLELILTLTRDLGVNLAGVEVVLSLARTMAQADMNFDTLLDYIRQTMLDNRHGIERENALVKLMPGGLTKAR